MELSDERARMLAAVRAGTVAARYGVYLGRTQQGWAWAESERSVLVLGPSRSGKTSSLIVPNVLAAAGAVVSTSTKTDVMRLTADTRRKSGPVLLYDPSGTVQAPAGVQRVGWSPVQAAKSWDGALLAAETMVGAARAAEGTTRSGAEAHWNERAMALLAPMLHAAALAGEPMPTVLRWIDRREASHALRVLGSAIGDVAPPTDTLVGIVATDEREQSGIWSTAAGVLSAYRSAGALRSTEPPLLDAEGLRSTGGTLYICAAGRRQQQLAPLVVGLLGDVRDATYRRAERATGNEPPVLLALDEAANIAPIPDLPSLVSEGGGQGLVTLACLQDLSQARRRWGPEADAFLSLFGTTIVFGGIADLPTLQAISALAGEREVLARSVGMSPSPDGRLRPSTSTAPVMHPRLPVDVVARGSEGMALALDARNRLGWVKLTPAHSCSPWRDLTASRLLDRSPPVREGTASLAAERSELRVDRSGR